MNNHLRALTAVAVLVTTSTLNAAQIPLSTSAPFTTLDQFLNAADDFAVVGDLVFDNFEYAWTGQMPSPAGINVLPIVDDNGYPGLRFQGGFVDDAGGDASDSLITFTVTSTGALISDAHLAANPDLFGGTPGTGLAAVTETFLPEITDDSITTYDNGSIEQLSDLIVFDTPQQSVNVQKDILLMSAENGAGAGLSFVDQTFSLVPEPSAQFGLLGAVIGLATLRRRRA